MSMLQTNLKSGKMSLTVGGKLVATLVDKLGSIATAIEKDKLSEAEAKQDIETLRKEANALFDYLLQEGDGAGKRCAHAKDTTILGQCSGLRYTAALKGSAWR